MDVDHEIKLLKEEMTRLGEKQDDGSIDVPFGVLFKDGARVFEDRENHSVKTEKKTNRCANIFEALVGTLKAAKKRKVVSYDAELLLSPMHDHIVIKLHPE